MKSQKGQRQEVKNTTVGDIERALNDIDVSDKNLVMFVGKGTQKTNSEFVIMFYQNVLADVLNSNLKLTDVKVMLGVLAKVSRGNVINLTQREIADALKIKQPQVSKAIKNLTAANIFITNEHGSLFLNPNYMVKQNLRSIKDSAAYKAAESILQATNYGSQELAKEQMAF